MRELVIRPRAYADLEGIWLYTDEHWGKEQANRYLRQLDKQILGLIAAPERGKNCETVRVGYYSLHVGRHLVFYTFTEEIVGIERVLHDQMDSVRHLQAPLA